MFRASPWISYEPSVPVDTTRNQIHLSEGTVRNDMDGDIDMDAPQISTLRDEETPPPIRTSKFRVKLLVNDSKGAPSSAPRKQGEDEDEDEDEDQEDQLIDDDPNPTTSLPRPPGAPGKRKQLNKRKPRKSEKRITEDERQPRDRDAMIKAIRSVEAPSEFHMNRESPPREPFPIDNVTPEPLPAKAAASKKKSSPKKTSVVPRPRAKAVPKSFKDVIHPLALDDPGTLSETYTGTAASSPIPYHHDAISPEPDNIDPHHISVPFTEETNLDSIPLPVYPLPSKPFPVQPPPKISAGFAPAISLDKSGTKVRHWRVANREIRGIAGGRWFAHAWVGEKESEFATSSAANSKAVHAAGDGDKASGVALPKLSSVSISGPSGKGGKAKLTKAQAAAASASAATSRSGSVIPDSHTARALAPTKMRTIIAAPPSEADSDMTAAI